MAYEKLKDENYKNLGGINIKASEYMTGENQVLNLRNYTFDRPGAWKSRPGYTGFATLNAGGSYAPDSIFEYINSGISAILSGLGGATVVVNAGPIFIYSSGTTLYEYTPTLQAIASGLGPGSSGAGPIDFQVVNNYLYFANGYSFKKYLGFSSISFNYSVPFGVSGSNFGLEPYYIEYAGATYSTQGTIGFTVPTGDYHFRVAPARYDPIERTYEYGLPATANGNANFTLVVPAPFSQSSMQLFFGTLAPPLSGTLFTNHGVSFMGIYLDGPIPDGNYYLWKTIPLTDLSLGNVFGATRWYYTATKLILTESSTGPETDMFFTLIPRYIENYNNMLFMAGFSGLPSTVYHSELGNPDVVEPEYFFEVRPNGDVVTTMKVFQDSLIIFKTNSVHELQGDSPDSISLKDTNLEYGCLSNQAAVTFENKLWFMDRKGIAEYNGANTFIVSSTVENFLEECDKDTARGYHLKKYSQVWFVVKVTGQSYYRTFVYDYLINSWSIYDNFNVTGGSNLFTNSDNTKDVVFYGQNATLQSKFMRFGQSLTVDDGYGITYISKTKFHKRLGDTTQEMWRRFYLNNEVESSVIGVTINFYPDYGSSIFESRNVSLGQFQTRIDFGISAKSLSVEMIIRASDSITINGYTIESRYLRSV